MIAIRKKTKLKKGENPDISNKDYHQDTEYLTSSKIKLLFSDPDLYYRKYVLKEDLPEYGGAHFTTGTYLHALLLEPDTIADTFVIYKGTRRGKAWHEFKADSKGKEIITQADYDMGQQLLDNTDFYSQLLLEGGEAELTLCGSLKDESSNDIKVKVRPDYINVDKGYIIDVKTTRTLLDSYAIKDVISQYDYDVAIHTYKSIAKQVYDKSFKYYFLFVCKNPIHTRLVSADIGLDYSGEVKTNMALHNLSVFNANLSKEQVFKQVTRAL